MGYSLERDSSFPHATHPPLRLRSGAFWSPRYSTLVCALGAMLEAHKADIVVVIVVVVISGSSDPSSILRISCMPPRNHSKIVRHKEMRPRSQHLGSFRAVGHYFANDSGSGKLFCCCGILNLSRLSHCPGLNQFSQQDVQTGRPQGRVRRSWLGKDPASLHPSIRTQSCQAVLTAGSWEIELPSRVRPCCHCVCREVRHTVEGTSQPVHI